MMMNYCLPLITILYLGIGLQRANGTINVVLIGLFAYNVSNAVTPHHEDIANGRIVQEAVEMAISDMSNANLQVKLDLRPYNTECDPARNAWAITDTLRDTQATSPVVVLGPPCEYSASYLVQITSRFTNIVTVSYAAQTPLVDNVTLYKSFFRTVPSFSDLNEALASVLMRFKWYRICLVLESEPFFNTIAEELPQSYSYINIMETFSTSNFKYISTDSYCRIFVVMTEIQHTPDIFCEALKKGLLGHQYQWIIYGNVKLQDLISNQRIDCSEQELSQAIQSSFIITFDTNSYHVKEQSDNFIPHDSKADFETALHEKLQNTTWFDSQVFNLTSNDLLTSESAYDATWLIGLALNASVQQLSLIGSKITDYLPLNNSFVSNTIIEQFESLNFVGISNKIDFSPQSHNVKSYIKLIQIQESRSGLELVPVGLYFESLNWTHYGNDLKWLGDGPPNDRPVPVSDNVPLWLQIVTFLVCVFGISLMTTFIIVNYVFKEKKVIKASSPHINALILLGCLLGFLSAIMYTISSITTIQNNIRSFSCNATVWSIILMFTLSFGSLLAKTWRVYAVFRNPWSKRRIYKDYMLFVIVLCMLSVDVVVLVGWMIVSPLHIASREILSPDAITAVSYCGINNEGVYCGLLLIAYKCLMLIFGCFLATQTRKIKAKTFNDSKYIAIAIYGVFLIVMVGLPLAVFMLLGFKILISFVSITVTIVGLSFLISCTVFLPKLYQLYKTRNVKEFTALSTAWRAETQRTVLRKQSTVKLASCLKPDYKEMTPEKQTNVRTSLENSSTLGRTSLENSSTLGRTSLENSSTLGNSCEVKRPFTTLKHTDELETSMYADLDDNNV